MPPKGQAGAPMWDARNRHQNLVDVSTSSAWRAAGRLLHQGKAQDNVLCHRQRLPPSLASTVPGHWEWSTPGQRVFPSVKWTPIPQHPRGAIAVLRKASDYTLFAPKAVCMDAHTIFDASHLSLATATPTARQRRLAIVIVAVVVIGTGIVTPFGAIQLRKIDGFVPATESAIIISDFFTAVLLFSQSRIVGSRGLLLLASGYLFSALMVVPHLLTFPGAFAPSGLLGAGLSTTAWLFIFWHLGLPASVIGYACLIDERRALTRWTVYWNITFVLGLVCVLTWIVTANDDALPALFVDQIGFTPLANYVTSMVFLVSVVALAMLWFRRKSVLDLWLTVAVCGLVAELAMTSFVIVSRFSLGFYTQRVFSLAASTIVLSALLAEAMALYGRLAKAIVLLDRERTDRLMSVEAATAVMAHEVRQPLTAIATHSRAGRNWLKRTPPDLEEVRGCLDSIIASSHRADEVIASIRGLYKKTISQRTMIDLNNVVRQALSLVSDDLQVNQIFVVTKYQENLPQINADETQLQQVILNLIRNAIDAMGSAPPSKKDLRLTTGFDDEKSMVSIIVEDSGSGIGAEERDRIFKPFFTTKSSGMGLGLSLCRTIVEDHGGNLRLIKTDSYGSIFEITLPISTAAVVLERASVGEPAMSAKSG
jgi:signal transduction histidine kinase